MTQKYPLDPLRRVREEAVDQKVRALSESLRHVEAAREEAERTERRKRDLESAVSDTRGAEQQRLLRGELTAGDLARGAAWGVAKEMERAEHGRAVDHARAREVAAEVETLRRQNDLTEAQASSELVERHHERWQRARAAEREAKDEEDAEGAHLGRFTRRGAQ